VLRRQQQMHMVRHQDMGVDLAAVFSRRSSKPIAIAIIVLLVEEDGLTIVATLDDMQRLIRQEITPEPRHRLSLPRITDNHSCRQ
jgi:hypothetical protein